MILPTLLYLLIFQIYPIIETVRISFTNWLLTDQSSGGYVGFANYTRLFTQDSNFWTLFRNSVFWVLGSTVLQYFFAIPISVLLNQKMRARGLWRGLMMVPWVTPMVIAGLIWRWMFEGNYGLFNQLLGTDIVWLADSSTVWICSDRLYWWNHTHVMFLAGLQEFRDLLGPLAGWCRPFRFWHYTTLLSPGIMSCVTSMAATWTKLRPGL
ncbi:MAG: carbohydrate ABC transporter permease [[Clostridium] leptum]